jgi:hypothetical protein
MGCPQADPASDPDGDGMNNANEFLTGTVPTDSASAFQVVSVTLSGNDLAVTWRGGVGSTGVVQVSSGSWPLNFSDISSGIVVPAAGTTNYTDVGSVTNAAARVYRVRLQ